MALRSREVRLARRPQGLPSADDFSVAEVEVAPLAPGEVLVRNLYTSVDPGQRGLMNGGESYVATYQVGRVLGGRTVGEVVDSRSAQVPVGTVVFHRLGWREFSVVPADEVRPLDTAGTDPADHLGVLGHPGLTAWLGVSRVAEVRPGDVVLVSSAAGAVGGMAGQLARLRGAAQVIGTVGSDAKADYIRTELGFTDALNYRTPDFAEQLARVAPKGIDFYFDNVGGAVLEAALQRMRAHGTVAICGATSTYNSPGLSPVRNFGAVLAQRLHLHGFLVYDHEEKMGEFLRELRPLLSEGAIAAPKTFFDGIDQAPRAFISLFDGSSVGKSVWPDRHRRDIAAAGLPAAPSKAGGRRVASATRGESRAGPCPADVRLGLPRPRGRPLTRRHRQVLARRRSSSGPAQRRLIGIARQQTDRPVRSANAAGSRRGSTRW
jgi:NADPH-dependent curcumin reductase CurA